MSDKVSAARRDVGGADQTSGSDDPEPHVAGAGKLVTSADTPGERGSIRSGQMPERRTTLRLTTEHGGRGTAAAPPTQQLSDPTEGADR